MKFDCLLERKEAKQLELLRCLLAENGQATVKQLAKKVGLSRTSILTYLEDLQQVIEAGEYECDLKLTEDEIVWEMAADFRIEEIASAFYQAALPTQILLYLLKNQEFTVVGLANKLMISESSVSRKIKEMNQFLAEFNLMIWQGRLVGEELQIRYFYFQFCWYLGQMLAPVEKQSFGNERLVAIFEKGLQLTFSTWVRERVDCWVMVSKYRLSVAQKEYRQLRTKMQFYQKDPLYRQLKEFVPRALGHYAVSLDDEEAMLHYVALIGLNFLGEEALRAYSLERSRFTPTALVDTLVVERIFRSYREAPVPPAIEQAVYQALIGTHFQLYFFEGELEVYDSSVIWQLEEKFSVHQFQPFVTALWKEVVSELDLAEKSTSQRAIIELKYLSLVTMVEQKLAPIYRIGLSLRLEAVFQEAAFHLFCLQLGKISGVVVEPFVAGQEYDLIVTNDPYLKEPHYLLSDLGWTYDFHQIYTILRKRDPH